MSVRQQIIDYSKGDHLGLFWRLFAWRSHTASRRLRAVQTFFLNRSARRHGGYIGKDAVFAGRPVLPHGLLPVRPYRCGLLHLSKRHHWGSGPRRAADRGSLPDWRRSSAGRRYYCG